MSTLSDLAHWFGSDLNVSISGDIETASGTERGQQRVLRRLLTNPGSYVFEPTYGAGLPSFIGQPLDIQKIQALCIGQMLLEDAVAKSPIPTVSVSQLDQSSINVTVRYSDQPTSAPVVLSFTVS